MPIVLDGSLGVTTPTYNGNTTAEYLVPVTQFKNRLINSAMVIDQRNSGASVTPSSGTGVYTVDRWQAYVDANSSITVQQSSVAPTGFVNSLLITSTAATTPSSGQIFLIRQRIEGFNTADLMWGTANAQTVTLSFWVRSSLTGTFGGVIKNSAGNRSYPFTFVISAANTFEYKTITVAGDTSGTWLTNNGTGIYLSFSLGAGSSKLGTAGAWVGSDFDSATGAVNFVATNGATLYLTGVQLERGSTATSFDYRPYGTELSLCYRYFQKFLGSSAYEALPSYAIAGSGGTAAEGFIAYKNTMRAAPTLSVSTLCLLDAASVFALTGASMINAGVDSARINYTGASGLTQFRSYYITANNSTSAFLTLSSEL